MRELASANPRSVVGFVDHANNDIGDLRICGLVLPGWVSSYLFWLGEETLQRLQHRLWDAEAVDSCVPGGTDEATFFSDRLSPDLREHVCQWLFHGGWYQSEPLSAENAERFAARPASSARSSFSRRVAGLSAARGTIRSSVTRSRVRSIGAQSAGSAPPGSPARCGPGIRNRGSGPRGTTQKARAPAERRSVRGRSARPARGAVLSSS
ncbi:MAG TPA: hypothetical protein VMU47_01285 [Caldimonas sp.]|nr:hypothetical protein [Caldimonas sp.]